MIVMTQSFEEWLTRYHLDLFGLLLFGHLEVLTPELRREYVEWCKTDEGKKYLRGGSEYDPNHRGNVAAREQEEAK